MKSDRKLRDEEILATLQIELECSMSFNGNASASSMSNIDLETPLN